MSNETLSLLQQAKQRMKSGYWINRVAQHDESVVKDDRSEEMYAIVCEILSSEQIITNPIDRLMDKAYYNSLSCDKKSGYVLEISRKYNELTRRYFKEHNN